MTGTRALVFRRGNVETVAQGELDAAGVVVFRLVNHQVIAV